MVAKIDEYFCFARFYFIILTWTGRAAETLNGTARSHGREIVQVLFSPMRARAHAWDAIIGVEWVEIPAVWMRWLRLGLPSPRISRQVFG